jgi:crotonobetainyl-CoA:carnitine CoA-transferase CaiB-like acyl-CoA transferase
VLARLIAQSDVLVENFRPGVLAQMGFDTPRLKTLKPDLIYCNISGFGTTGPYRDRPSFDFIAQAMSGFMSVTGMADGPPLRAGPPIADLVAGLHGALGICAALVKRGRTGPGETTFETVGASLNNGLISLLVFLAANYLATGEEPARTGNDHAIVSPYGMFQTRDGEVAVAPSQEQSYQRLIDALGLAELRGDPRFATNDLRVRNRDAVNAAIEARLVTETTEYWIDKLNAAGVPCGGSGARRSFRRPANHRPANGAEPGSSRPWHWSACSASRSNSPSPLRVAPPTPSGADTDAVLTARLFRGRDRPPARCR